MCIWAWELISLLCTCPDSTVPLQQVNCFFQTEGFIYLFFSHCDCCSISFGEFGKSSCKRLKIQFFIAQKLTNRKSIVVFLESWEFYWLSVSFLGTRLIVQPTACSSFELFSLYLRDVSNCNSAKAIRPH